MDTFEPDKAIVPIVLATKGDPINEILGTGCIVGNGENYYILTAKHIFNAEDLIEEDKYAFVLKGETGIGIYSISKITVALDYDVAICDIEYVEGMLRLPFSKIQPALNQDVFCFEYSTTSIVRNPGGGKHVSFQPLAHKGNIMRYYESGYPEIIKTPCFNTSFPALQGASGAPVIGSTKEKNFYIAGIIVANQETHLLPAQMVEILDGDKYIERTSYYLPMGKGINASIISQIIEDLGISLEYCE